jgi:hypothetical protein
MLVNAERTSITMMVKEAVTTYYAFGSAEETVWAGEGEQKRTKPLEQ